MDMGQQGQGVSESGEKERNTCRAGASEQWSNEVVATNVSQTSRTGARISTVRQAQAIHVQTWHEPALHCATKRDACKSDRSKWC
jgi:hypothetical protein